MTALSELTAASARSASPPSQTPPPSTPTRRTEPLQEFTDSRGATVRLDRSASVLQGVKLLGLASRNGRRYREAALQRAMPLYEGAKVNVNHPAGDPLSPRDYRDRIGVIRGVRLRPGDGLYGALHFNPKHPLAEQLVWDAEHAPENVGFSHNVLARTARDGAGLVVESIEKVQSVDLVADPATTKGLFEQAAEPTLSALANALPVWDRLTLHELELHRPDLLAELAEQHQQQLAALNEQIDDLATREASAVRRQRIHELLAKHALPLPEATSKQVEPAAGDAFFEALLWAPDDASLVRLVEERAKAIAEAKNSAVPVTAREQIVTTDRGGAAADNAQAFVASITAR